MEFYDVIEKRHCCRSYDPNKMVDDELISKIVDAGKKAPNAGGFDSIKITIAKSQGDKDKIISTIPERMHWIKTAPVLLVIWSDPQESIDRFGERARDVYIIQESGAAAENTFLAAVALGLSAGWVGVFDEEQLGKTLNLKANQRPSTVMPIGYKS